jgi:hypothetical protein
MFVVLLGGALLLAATSAMAGGVDEKPDHVLVYFIDWSGMERKLLSPEDVRRHAKIVLDIRGEPLRTSFLKSLALNQLSSEPRAVQPESAKLVIDILQGATVTRSIYATRFYLVDSDSNMWREIDDEFRARFESILD